MQKVFSIDYPPTDSERWALDSNTASGLDATKRANAKAVLITVEGQSIRYMIDGTTANGSTSGNDMGHVVAAAGSILIKEPTGKALDNLSIVNASSGAAATLQITYF